MGFFSAPVDEAAAAALDRDFGSPAAAADTLRVWLCRAGCGASAAGDVAPPAASSVVGLLTAARDFTASDDAAAATWVAAGGAATCAALSQKLFRDPAAAFGDAASLAAAPSHRGGSDEEESETALQAATEAAVELCAAITANCCGRAARSAAARRFTFVPDAAAGPVGAAAVSVDLSFEDYARAETGAMVWAGGVGLAAALCEAFVASSAPQPTPGESVRVDSAAPPTAVVAAELGCGPALPSAVLAAIVARQAAGRRAAVPPARWVHETTDLVPATAERGAAAVRAAWLAAAGESATAVTAEFAAQTLDFGAVPAGLGGRYDLVFGSDICYSFAAPDTIAAALAALLRPPARPAPPGETAAGSGPPAAKSFAPIAAWLAAAAGPLAGSGTSERGGGGGVAFLCNEAHRDGAGGLVDACRRHPALAVRAWTGDLRGLLRAFTVPPGVGASSTIAVVVQRVR